MLLLVDWMSVQAILQTESECRVVGCESRCHHKAGFKAV